MIYNPELYPIIVMQVRKHNLDIPVLASMVKSNLTEPFFISDFDSAKCVTVGLTRN